MFVLFAILDHSYLHVYENNVELYYVDEIFQYYKFESEFIFLLYFYASTLQPIVLKVCRPVAWVWRL